ncbi:MAG: hypothetical protein M1823_002835 [Watsoniomyces obsoletus]|nr:MAG: hypothetical protein M1823_002835 [Watsoniomyces obsoletus]
MAYPLVDEDADAEHEDDPMMDDGMFIPRHAALDPPKANLLQIDFENPEKDGASGGDDADAEGDDDDEADTENNDAAVGAVKELGEEPRKEETEEVGGDAEHVEEPLASVEEGEDVDVGSDQDVSDKLSSDTDSEGLADWQDPSDDPDEEDGPTVADHCIFCGADEDHDPSEEYEEYLACSVCDDNGENACRGRIDSVREAQTRWSQTQFVVVIDTASTAADHWRCPACVENALEPDTTADRRDNPRTSAHKLTRDLLPAQRGGARPGSHSVFNQLIVNEDPLDGSRLLRKRKASTEDVEEPIQTSRKRPRMRTRSGSAFQAAPQSPAESDHDEDEKTTRESSEEPVARKAPRRRAAGARRSRPRQRPRPRASRARPQQVIETPSVRIIARDRYRKKFKLAIRVDPAALAKILNPEAPRARRNTTRPPETQAQQTFAYPTPFSSNYATPFYSFHERENDELKSKPYGGILSEVEADTSKTLPQAADRERFNEAKRKAEEAWLKKTAENADESTDALSQKVAGPASKIQCISFGGYEIDTWYAAPYPEEYSRNRVLYICEFCLKYMNSEYVAWRHKLKCPAKHPPGDEIYRDGSISVFEVDGRKNPVYCQNLCLLAKLFLGSKTLYYDVEPFLFYVMTEYDDLGCRFVGYFSKEKRPSSTNNVSCILTLPIHQRKGYGNLLIDFSYLLTRVEQKTGSPEKPLSDMGLVSYRNYWRLVLCYQLRDQKDPISITDISKRTGMTADDIVSALEGLRALVRDPVTGTYALRLDHNYFREYIEKWEAKKYLWLNPDCLLWTPYLMGRSNLAHLEHAPPLATLAPREGEEEDNENGEQPSASVEEVMNVNGSHGDEMNSQSSAVPSIGVEKASFGGHPLPGPPPKTPLVRAASFNNITKISNGLTMNTAPPKLSIPPAPTIPPARFEIFPPLPGTASRKRAGRPPASGRRRTATPASLSRRNTTAAARRTVVRNGHAPIRRTTSNSTGKPNGTSPLKRSTRGNTSGGQGETQQDVDMEMEVDADVEVEVQVEVEVASTSKKKTKRGTKASSGKWTAQQQMSHEQQLALRDGAGGGGDIVMEDGDGDEGDAKVEDAPGESMVQDTVMLGKSKTIAATHESVTSTKTMAMEDVEMEGTS